MRFYAVFTFKKTLRHIFLHLGGPGLVLLGLVDNSFIPTPGGMDVCTILLAAAHHEPWWYYALMATIGSLVGGYLTYRLGAEGGKETLEKRLSKKQAAKVYRIFERYGFASIAVGALCPPPVPIVPFLLAPGALHYPRLKFLAALALGRSIRYTALAYLGSIYGRAMFHWLSRYYRPLLYALIALGVIGGLAALYYWRRHKRNSAQPTHEHAPAPKATGT